MYQFNAISYSYTSLVGLILMAGIAHAQVADSPDKDYSAELPRLPAKSASEAFAEFEVLDGFELQLVASEPLVTDPVAFAFDSRGRLFVVEMRDYSEQATEHLGRVALLEDSDGDGVMDQRFNFVDGLSWPTAIWPWRDGVLVAEPPRITWYRDTDGDRQSDTHEDWFTGFARSNVQGLVNSFRWGVDGRVHGATSSSGADIEFNTSIDRPPHTLLDRIELGRRDFSIDPLRKTLQPESGGGQHGLSFNRWGDKFVTSNSDHLQQIIDLDDWLSKHATGVPMPSSRRSIATDGPQAEVFRASPVEPWRIVRTRLRVSGVAPGIVEGGGRAAGYFTGATGTWIVNEEFGFGAPGFDTALVCDVGSNLVHRKRMNDEGMFWSGSRLDEATELLRSRDTWFRPVQLGDGPDGALYIADMAREVIEHPLSLPPMIKQHLDLTSGRDRGRIWRLSTAQTPSIPPVNLAELTLEKLVERLDHPIPWQRLMASQLILERGSKSILIPLQRMVAQATRPESRLLALHVAARLEVCDPLLLAAALQDPHPRVVEQAIRLAGELGVAGEIVESLEAQASTDDARVQLALAMVAADLSQDHRWRVLGPLMSRVKDPLVRAAVATSAGRLSWQLLAQVSTQPERQETMNDEVYSQWLTLLLPSWAEQATDDDKLSDWLQRQVQPENAKLMLWLDGLRGMATRRAADKVIQLLSEPEQQAIFALIESKLSPPYDARLLGRIGLLPELNQQVWLDRVLTPSTPEVVQSNVIQSLAWAGHPELAPALLANFSAMTPMLQKESLRVIGERGGWLTLLANALESKVVLRSQIAPEFRQQLLNVREPDLAARFTKLLDGVSADRAEVIARYASCLELSDTADAKAGRVVFERVCAQCHRIGGAGNDVGPPLKQLADKSPQQLLETILDPNREVDPKYASFALLLDDGRALAGIVRDESTSQIILAEAGGTTHTIARAQIEQIRSSGISFMPVGLEEQVSVEQMSALIHFLRTAGQPQ